MHTQSVAVAMVVIACHSQQRLGTLDMNVQVLYDDEDDHSQGQTNYGRCQLSQCIAALRHSLLI